MVRRFVAQFQREQQARQRATVSFETGPGVEAQFDWKGSVQGQGLLQSDPAAKVWPFRFVLAYSRRRFTRAVTTTVLAAVLLGLREIFERQGGAPHHLAFDNPKPRRFRLDRP